MKFCKSTRIHTPQRERELCPIQITADGSILLWPLKPKRLFCKNLYTRINRNAINEFLMFHSDTEKVLQQLKLQVCYCCYKNNYYFFYCCCLYNSHKTAGHYDPDKIPRGSQRRHSLHGNPLAAVLKHQLWKPTGGRKFCHIS